MNGFMENLSSFGVKIFNVSEAPVELSGIENGGIFGFQDIVINMLVEQYTGQIKSNVMRILGASDLFGNR